MILLTLSLARTANCVLARESVLYFYLIWKYIKSWNSKTYQWLRIFIVSQLQCSCLYLYICSVSIHVFREYIAKKLKSLRNVSQIKNILMSLSVSHFCNYAIVNYMQRVKTVKC